MTASALPCSERFCCFSCSERFCLTGDFDVEPGSGRHRHLLNHHRHHGKWATSLDILIHGCMQRCVQLTDSLTRVSCACAGDLCTLSLLFAGCTEPAFCFRRLSRVVFWGASVQQLVESVRKNSTIVRPMGLRVSHHAAWPSLSKMCHSPCHTERGPCTLNCCLSGCPHAPSHACQMGGTHPCLQILASRCCDSIALCPPGFSVKSLLGHLCKTGS